MGHISWILNSLKYPDSAGFGTQDRREAPVDLRIKQVHMQQLTPNELGCLLFRGPKLALGANN